MTLFFPYFPTGGLNLPLIQVLVCGECQKLNKLVVCNDYVEYLSGSLEFTPGELLFADSRSDFLKFIAGQFLVQFDSYLSSVIQDAFRIMNPLPDLSS